MSSYPPARQSPLVILHGDPVSGNVHKPKMLMDVLGIHHEHVPTSWEDGGTTSAEYLKLNPNGKVPCLIDGDFVLWESNAILCYLAEGTPWLPDDRKQRAQVMQWLFWEQYSHEPYVAVMRAIAHYEADPARRVARIEAKRPEAERALRIMDEHLANRDWFVGDGPTIADLSLFAYTHVAEEGTLSLAPYGNVRAWIDRVAAVPGVQRLPGFITA